MAIQSESKHDEPATIIAKKKDRMQRGWHCIGIAEHFRDGQPHKVEAFGQTLVAFANADGEIGVLDGFCPHMGAALWEGQIKDDNLACPFHDWRWGNDGRCKWVPYAKRTPSRARVRHWESAVINDLLLIWYDPEGSKADWDALPPEIPNFDECSPWAYQTIEVNVPGRELMDNMVDAAHFFYVHGHGVAGMPTFFANIFENENSWQIMEMGNEMPDRDKLKLGWTMDEIPEGNERHETAYYGPSYLLSRRISHYYGDRTENYIVLGQQPNSVDNFKLHILLCVRENPKLSVEENSKRTTAIVDMMNAGILQDVHIWQTKTIIDNPLLCDSDGPVYQLRRWYEQFFIDKADIKPEMVERFEYVTETKHSIEVWKKQAQENLKKMEEAGITSHWG